MINKFT